MKLFQMKEIREAIEYSMQGGQALHVHTLNSGHWLFKRYPEIGHLFDQNKQRLIYLAGRLGVNVIKIEHEGTPRQHIDLCGKPFSLAKSAAQLCVETESGGGTSHTANSIENDASEQTK